MQFSTADRAGASDELAIGTPLRRPPAASVVPPITPGPPDVVFNTFGTLYVSPPPALVQDSAVALYLAENKTAPPPSQAAAAAAVPPAAAGGDILWLRAVSATRKWRLPALSLSKPLFRLEGLSLLSAFLFRTCHASVVLATHHEF